MKLLAWLVRLGLAAVFLGAAAVKIWDPAAFHTAILTYRILPESWVPSVALWLPWVEVCTGLALLRPRHRRAALWIVAVLTTVFLFAIGQAAWRGIDIVCGCFGRDAAVRGPVYFEYIARDLVFLLAAAWLLRREARPPAPASR